MRKFSGNNLVQYGLPIALVMVVSIPVMQSLSQSTSDVFKKELSGKPRFDGAATASALSTTLPATSYSKRIPVSQSAPPFADAKTVSLQLSNGKTVDLPAYPSDLKSVVETAGANGATEFLAQYIESLAYLLAASGEITPTQATSLKNLANQGHEIAQREGALNEALKQAIESGTPSSEINSTEFDYNNNKTNVSEMISTIADDYFPEDSAGLDQYLTGITNTNAVALKQFMDLYKTASTDGSLNNPAVAAIIKELSFGIVNIAENVESSFIKIDIGTVKPEEFKLDVAKNMTDTHSTGICSTGNGADSGVKCTG
jgi:hypothetical protein